MLTLWGKKIAQHNFSANSGIIPLSLNSSNNAAIITAKTCANNEIYIAPALKSSGYAFISSLTETGSSASYGIAVGSDDTPATENDYSLGSLITTLSGSIPSAAYGYDSTSHKYGSYLDITLSNNTANDIIVKEVGRFVSVYKASSLYSNTGSSATDARCIMIDRAVLDSPVTIPANNVGVVRYEFQYE